jgi:hypothetical protein
VLADAVPALSKDAVITEPVNKAFFKLLLFFVIV